MTVPAVDEPVLGVDCGGGSTRAVLVTPDGAARALHAGPLNALLHADLPDVVARLAAESGAARVGVGVPGLRAPADHAALAADLRARTGRPVAVAEDVEVARLAAHAGGPGIVVVAGTGSSALGVDAGGNRARAGGHGFLLGDEGSGYWVGRQAAAAALHGRDGTGPATALTELLHAHFPGGLDGMVVTVHRAPAERGLLSGLTRLVATAAVDGDEVAGRILDDAAGHLARLAAAVAARLDAPLPVAMVGGLFAVDRLRTGFVAATGAVPAAGPPELGAVRLALTAGARR